MLMLDDDLCDEGLLLSDSTAEIRAFSVSALSPFPTVVIDKTPAAVAVAVAVAAATTGVVKLALVVLRLQTKVN